jgi:hypothetical protein
MLSLDFAFYSSKLRVWFRMWRFRLRGVAVKDNVYEGGGGFEEEIEKQMRMVAKDHLGVEIDERAFVG